jgi:hypothetical protein
VERDGKVDHLYAHNLIHSFPSPLNLECMKMVCALLHNKELLLTCL